MRLVFICFCVYSCVLRDGSEEFIILQTPYLFQIWWSLHIDTIFSQNIYFLKNIVTILYFAKKNGKKWLLKNTRCVRYWLILSFHWLQSLLYQSVSLFLCLLTTEINSLVYVEYLGNILFHSIPNYDFIVRFGTKR